MVRNLKIMIKTYAWYYNIRIRIHIIELAKLSNYLRYLFFLKNKNRPPLFFTLSRRWFGNLKLENGYIYRKIPNHHTSDEPPNTEWKLCVPKHQRTRVLHETHDDVTAGHLGIPKNLSSSRGPVRKCFGTSRNTSADVTSVSSSKQTNNSQPEKCWRHLPMVGGT